MFSQIYMSFITASFIALCLRHYYLIHIKLDRYMHSNHRIKWEKMKKDTGWYRPSWATLYYSKAVYDFIWHSDESFGDQTVVFQKRVIRRVILELASFFVIVIVLTLSLILSGILR